MKYSKWIASLSSGIALALFATGAVATTRHYYVAAEDVVWDFAPSNKNLIHCHNPAGCPIPDPWTDSHIFNKVRYIEYTNASFNTKVPQPVWLGVLGPIIRAEEGDTVIVRFCNRTTSLDPATGGPRMLGMHPHGFRYTKNNEGAHYRGVNSGQPPGTGSEIAPGQCFNYHWEADADSAPAAGDVSSKVWWYHSHVDEALETNAGLLGPIIITKEGRAKRDGSPVDVDREFVTLFMVFDELGGEEPGLMHSINGYFFGNLKGLIMNNGERVRWHVLGMGNEVDNHSVHWHGKTVTIGHSHVARRTDVVELMPASMVTVDMLADNPGEWMFHCHVSDHILGGMVTTYQIKQSRSEASEQGDRSEDQRGHGHDLSNQEVKKSRSEASEQGDRLSLTM